MVVWDMIYLPDKRYCHNLVLDSYVWTAVQCIELYFIVIWNNEKYAIPKIIVWFSSSIDSEQNNGVIEWRLDCNRNNWTKPLLSDNFTTFLMCT